MKPPRFELVRCSWKKSKLKHPWKGMDDRIYRIVTKVHYCELYRIILRIEPTHIPLNFMTGTKRPKKNLKNQKTTYFPGTTNRILVANRWKIMRERYEFGLWLKFVFFFCFFLVNFLFAFFVWIFCLFRVSSVFYCVF